MTAPSTPFSVITGGSESTALSFQLLSLLPEKASGHPLLGPAVSTNEGQQRRAPCLPPATGALCSHLPHCPSPRKG